MADPELTTEHMEQLRAAKRALESVGVAMQIANLIGTPVEKAIEWLPQNWREGISGISRDALEKAADVAIWTMAASYILGMGVLSFIRLEKPTDPAATQN